MDEINIAAKKNIVGMEAAPFLPWHLNQLAPHWRASPSESTFGPSTCFFQLPVHALIVAAVFTAALPVLWVFCF